MRSGISDMGGNYEELLAYDRTVLPGGMIVLTKKMPMPNNLAYVEIGTRRGGSFFGPPEVFHCMEHLAGPAFRERISDDATDATTEVHRMTIAECHVHESRLTSKLEHIARDLHMPPLKGLRRELNAMLVEWGNYHDDPNSYLETVFLKQCFPKSNIACSLDEQRASIRHTITRAVVNHYWKKFLVPGNLITVVVTKDMPHEKICEKAERAFLSMTKREAPRFRRPALGTPTASLNAPHHEMRGWLKNAHFMVGAPILRFPNHLETVASMVGSMFESYLNHILRYRRHGLVYHVRFRFISNYLFSCFAVSGECERRNLDLVIKAIKEKSEVFRVSERELERAKARIVESWLDRSSNPKTYADQIYQAEVDGVDLKRAYAAVKNLTPDGMLRFWKRYFQNKNKVSVVLKS